MAIVKSQAIRLYCGEEEISRLKEMSKCTCVQYFIGIYSHLTGKIVLHLKQSLRKYRIILASLLQFSKYIYKTKHCMVRENLAVLWSICQNLSPL